MWNTVIKSTFDFQTSLLVCVAINKWFYLLGFSWKEYVLWVLLPMDKAICNACSTNPATVALLLSATSLSSSSSWTLVSDCLNIHCTCAKVDLWVPGLPLEDLWSCCSHQPLLPMIHFDRRWPRDELIKMHYKCKHEEENRLIFQLARFKN